MSHIGERLYTLRWAHKQVRDGITSARGAVYDARSIAYLNETTKNMLDEVDAQVEILFSIKTQLDSLSSWPYEGDVRHLSDIQWNEALVSSLSPAQQINKVSLLVDRTKETSQNIIALCNRIEVLSYKEKQSIQNLRRVYQRVTNEIKVADVALDDAYDAKKDFFTAAIENMFVEGDSQAKMLMPIKAELESLMSRPDGEGGIRPYADIEWSDEMKSVSVEERSTKLNSLWNRIADIASVIYALISRIDDYDGSPDEEYDDRPF